MTALPAVRHYAEIIGDGESQRFVIKHSLQTANVHVEVLDAHTFEVVMDASIEVLSYDEVAVDFSNLLVYTPKRTKRGKAKAKGQLKMLPGRIPESNSLRVLISG